MKGRSQISAISLRNLAVAHLNRVSASSEANTPLLQPKLLKEVPAAGNLHPMAQPLPLGAEEKLTPLLNGGSQVGVIGLCSAHLLPGSILWIVQLFPSAEDGLQQRLWIALVVKTPELIVEPVAVDRRHDGFMQRVTSHWLTQALMP